MEAARRVNYNPSCLCSLALSSQETAELPLPLHSLQPRQRQHEQLSPSYAPQLSLQGLASNLYSVVVLKLRNAQLSLGSFWGTQTDRVVGQRGAEEGGRGGKGRPTLPAPRRGTRELRCALTPSIRSSASRFSALGFLAFYRQRAQPAPIRGEPLPGTPGPRHLRGEGGSRPSWSDWFAAGSGASRPGRGQRAASPARPWVGRRPLPQPARAPAGPSTWARRGGDQCGFVCAAHTQGPRRSPPGRPANGRARGDLSDHVTYLGRPGKGRRCAAPAPHCQARGGAGSSMFAGRKDWSALSR